VHEDENGQRVLIEIAKLQARCSAFLILVLPDLDGMEVLKRLREIGAIAPVVVLTVRDVCAGKMGPLSDTGADDTRNQAISRPGYNCLRASRSTAKTNRPEEGSGFVFKNGEIWFLSILRLPRRW